VTNHPERLPLDADQDRYDEWLAAKMRRVNDPDDELMYVDVNDGILVYVVARTLAERHPDKLEALREHTPEAVEGAMTERGTFMGVEWLARQVGLDDKEARQTVLGVMTEGMR